ncbi:apidaecins type 73-like [Drosophila madeirensis]
MVWHHQTLHITWASGPAPVDPDPEEARVWEEAPSHGSSRDPRRKPAGPSADASGADASAAEVPRMVEPEAADPAQPAEEEPEAAEVETDVPEALKVLRAAATILRAEARAQEERAGQAEQRPAAEPQAESAAESSEPWERGPWLWPEPAPPAPTLKRPTAETAPPAPPFRRQASCPEPRRGHRPTLQRQASEPTGRRWTLLEPEEWPEAVVRAQASARLTGRRTNRLVTERGVRYRVTMSAAGTTVFRDLRAV